MALSPDVSPVIPKAAMHYDISTDDIIDTESLVFPSELCDPSDNISANTSHVSITDHCSSSDQHMLSSRVQNRPIHWLFPREVPVQYQPV